MSDIIHLLPDSVANQIAAGEVIQRPASVLKELVENSIDAGATYIQIVIQDAGRTLIQVTDNGKGMSETDARMAFERHATSKITQVEDLFSLRTMGFRGEALASIASVAQVELRTRRQEDELGVMIEIAGSRVFKQESVQTTVGTTFLVKNLFFNVPARRRFLKSDNVEKSHIFTEFYRIALVNNDITFSVLDGQEEVFQLPAANKKVRIEQIFSKVGKKKWQNQLLPIESDTNLVNVSGYVGKPEFAQKSATQYFFVNGRYMRHPYFHKAVMLAFSQMIQANESPNYFIYLTVDPQTIDINIHPTKTEIKFENEQAIWSILNACVKEVLGKFNVVPSIDFDQADALEIPVASRLENIRPPQTNFNPNYNPFKSSESYKRNSLDWETLYNNFDSVSPKPDAELSSAEMSLEEIIIPSAVQPIPLNQPTKHSVYQFKTKFIVTSLASGLMFIHQQRAHMRILFDHYMQLISKKESVSQQLLFPEQFSLSHADSLLFDTVLPELKFVGFEIRSSESAVYEIFGIPEQINPGSINLFLMNLLDKVKHATEDVHATLQSDLALSLAKFACVKVGQKLTEEEMNDLIDRLFSCQNQQFSPEGKKIVEIMSMEELDSRFN